MTSTLEAQRHAGWLDRRGLLTSLTALTLLHFTLPQISASETETLGDEIEIVDGWILRRGDLKR